MTEFEESVENVAGVRRVGNPCIILRSMYLQSAMSAPNVSHDKSKFVT